MQIIQMTILCNCQLRYVWIYRIRNKTTLFIGTNERDRKIMTERLFGRVERMTIDDEIVESSVKYREDAYNKKVVASC